MFHIVVFLCPPPHSPAKLEVTEAFNSANPQSSPTLPQELPDHHSPSPQSQRSTEHRRRQDPNEGFRGRSTLSRYLPALSGHLQPQCQGVTHPVLIHEHCITFWTEGCICHGVWDTLWDVGEEHFGKAQDLWVSKRGNQVI